MSRGLEVSILLLIFAWTLQQCTSNALRVTKHSISLAVFVCSHSHTGHVTSYQLHFSARISLSRVRCNGDETNITHCSLTQSSSCSNSRVARVSCDTGMWCSFIITDL